MEYRPIFGCQSLSAVLTQAADRARHVAKARRSIMMLRLPRAVKVRLGRLKCNDSYIPHDCMGTWLLVEGPEPAHIHCCKTSCVLEPDRSRPDDRSFLDS